MTEMPMILPSIAVVARHFELLQFIKRDKVHAVNGTSRHGHFHIRTFSLEKGASSPSFHHLERGRGYRGTLHSSIDAEVGVIRGNKRKNGEIHFQAELRCTLGTEIKN
jgi:hypothetical protein